MDALSLILALLLGFVLGTGVGTGIALRVIAARRAMLQVGSAFARLWPSEVPARSAADILAGVVRVSVGGIIYTLPVLPRGASRRWLETIEERWAALPVALEAAGNDGSVILQRLATETDALLDMLISYDQSGILPSRAEIDELASDTEIFRAVLEVWRAANPLAATLAETSDETSGTSPAPPSTSPMPTAGTHESLTSA